MSGKNQFPFTLNWQSTNPAPFIPNAQQSGGSVPSGALTGAMASTNTIYTNVVDMSRMDNIGLAITWTGTPTGTLSVMGANADQNFYALTFNPVLGQPAGAAGGYLIDLTQYPFKFLMLQYVNASGAGVLTATGQARDLN